MSPRSSPSSSPNCHLTSTIESDVGRWPESELELGQPKNSRRTLRCLYLDSQRRWRFTARADITTRRLPRPWLEAWAWCFQQTILRRARAGLCLLIRAATAYVPPIRRNAPHRVRAQQMALCSIVAMRKPGVIATGRQIRADAAITGTGIATVPHREPPVATAVAGLLEVPRITAPRSFDLTGEGF
jgi:hypothetical protein